jgi:hypothetical protein
MHVVPSSNTCIKDTRFISIAGSSSHTDVDCGLLPLSDLEIGLATGVTGRQGRLTPPVEIELMAAGVTGQQGTLNPPVEIVLTTGVTGRQGTLTPIEIEFTTGVTGRQWTLTPPIEIELTTGVDRGRLLLL